MPAPPPPGAAPDTPQPPAGRAQRFPASRFWLPAGLAALGFLLRLIPVLRGGGLRGMDTHDPYVYYASGVALFSGKLPYRDFLFLHPPGILLALQPFAALGGLIGDSFGMAAARVGFMLIGTLNVLLIYRLLQPVGVVAAAVGAGLYAVWFPAVYVERTVRLEGLATLLLLLSLLVLERLGRTSRPLLLAAGAGALVGLTATVKLWGLVPTAVVAAWLLWQHGWRAAAAASAGAAGAVLAVVAPFALVAPSWFSALVLEQLGRDRSVVSIPARLLGIVGMGGIPPPWSFLVLAVAGLLTVLALVIAFGDQRGRLPVLLVVVCSAVLLAGPSWYRHYPAFVAAPLCMVYGIATGVVVARFSPLARRVALASVAVLVAASAIVQLSLAPGRVLPLEQLDQALRERQGCVTSDRPAATLVLTDRLRTNLAQGCRVVLDLVGYRVIRDRHSPAGPPQGEAHTQFVTEYLASAPTAVLLLSLAGFTPAQRERIESWPIVADIGTIEVRAPQ